MSEEEYRKARQDIVVERIYGGNDSLPMETKEQMLMKVMGIKDGTEHYYLTRASEDGTAKVGRVPMWQRVACLEAECLMNLRPDLFPFC